MVRHLSLQARDGLPPIWDGGDLRPVRAFGVSEALALAVEGWERAWYGSGVDAENALVMGGDVAQWLANEVGAEVDYEDGFVYRPRRRPKAPGPSARPARRPTLREYRLDLMSRASDRDHHLGRLENRWRFEFAEELAEVESGAHVCLRFGTESIDLTGPFSLTTGGIEVTVDPGSGAGVERAEALNYDILIDGLVHITGDLELRFASGAELRSTENDEYQPWEIWARSFHFLRMPGHEAGTALWTFSPD